MTKKNKKAVTIAAIIAILGIIAIILAIVFTGAKEKTDDTLDGNTGADNSYNLLSSDEDDDKAPVTTPLKGEGWVIVSASEEKQGNETLTLQTEEYEEVVYASPEASKADIVEEKTVEDAVENSKNDDNFHVVNTDEVHIHNFVTTTTAATCTNNGSIHYECECGANYDEVIPATGHNYNVVVVEATCEHDGSKTSTCTACGHQEVEIIAKLNCEISNPVVETPVETPEAPVIPDEITFGEDELPEGGLSAVEAE